MLPAISLGLWHNFGADDDHEVARALVLRAWKRGVTHFDLANNYGPPPGSAERTFGRILRDDLAGERDRMIVSTKAGYPMWEGPYGDGGSRKYLLASLDQSLERLRLDYVDVFYHHRPDPHTPLEETMGALDQAVRSGRALYAGVSNYDAERTRAAHAMLTRMGTPFVIHQPKYSMLQRAPEQGLFDALRETGLGCIVFSPLAQGLLTDRYVDGLPSDSRAASEHGALKRDAVTPRVVEMARRLRDIARPRGQTVAQLAIAWTLRDPVVTSALVGASRVEQLEQNLGALENLEFDDDELAAIDRAVST